MSHEFGRLFSPAENPNWWTKSISRSDAILYDYTKLIFLAQHLNLQMLFKNIQDIGLKPSHRKLAQSLAWIYVSDLPLHQRGEKNPKGAMKLIAKVAQQIRIQSEDRLRKVMLSKDYFPFFRHVLNYDHPSRDTSHPLKQAMLNRELADGFVTATFILWKDQVHQSDIAQLPNYLDQDFRPMLFANQRSATKIAKYCNSFKYEPNEKNVLIAAVDQIHGAVLPSTKEPELLEAQAGYACDESKYSINWIYDTTVNTEYKVKPKMKKCPWIGTLGGFLNVASMARIASLQLYIAKQIRFA